MSPILQTTASASREENAILASLADLPRLLGATYPADRSKHIRPVKELATAHAWLEQLTQQASESPGRALLPGTAAEEGPTHSAGCQQSWLTAGPSSRDRTVPGTLSPLTCPGTATQIQCG